LRVGIQASSALLTLPFRKKEKTSEMLYNTHFNSQAESSRELDDEDKEHKENVLHAGDSGKGKGILLFNRLSTTQ
jgi:hypothetical protein